MTAAKKNLQKIFWKPVKKTDSSQEINYKKQKYILHKNYGHTNIEAR